MGLGKLVGNLQSLELMMRLFLSGATSTPLPGASFRFDLFAVQPGDEVPEDAFSNYDTLAQVIEKYNESV